LWLNSGSLTKAEDLDEAAMVRLFDEVFVQV
jgi:hypothetical protein